jgi:hypothetical protein
VISVIVTASDDPKPLARLLTALVPAAADGLVKEVAVVGAAGPSEELADDAGADLRASFAEAVAQAKGEWVAGLPLAAVFTTDWMHVIAQHMARDEAAPARLTARANGLSLSGGPEGWLVPRKLVPSAVAAEQDIHRLARRGGRRLRILDRR